MDCELWNCGRAATSTASVFSVNALIPSERRYQKQGSTERGENLPFELMISSVAMNAE